MKATPTQIPDVWIIEPRDFGDERCFFFESFNEQAFNNATGNTLTFVQDNHSKSVKGVLRGLHYQLPPKAHGFLTLSYTAEFLYKTTDYWSPEHERAIMWNDETLRIDWPFLGIEPHMLEQDKAGKAFMERIEG